jgi:putative phosphoribosyl transferase
MRYADRRHAGALLGAEVASLHPLDPVVYALPRGGVPVGFEVASALDCPLDVLVVRKVGVPYQPELAMGAIAEGDVTIRNAEVIALTRVTDEVFAAAAEMERAELDRRVASYRDVVDRIHPSERTALVVDDGLATGSTALAALEALRLLGASQVWLAVPVAPAGSLGALEAAADRIVAPQRPRSFQAVGMWYRDFDQTTDAEVRDLLTRSRLP